MRILLANEARAGGGGVETYLASIRRHLEARGHPVALLYANPAEERGPTEIAGAGDDGWSVADLGIGRALAAAAAWQPDVVFSHNMRALEIDEQLAARWPLLKMMHGYFGTCVSGHKAFSWPSITACPRACDAGCLVYYLPRRCGQLRPAMMLSQYDWARRQQAMFPRYRGIVVASAHMRDQYLRQGVPAGDVHTIPLFADPVACGGPVTRDIDVLFLGRLTSLKGATVLVDALKRTVARRGPMRAVIAGVGPERDALARSAASTDGLSVDLPGWVDAAQRAGLFARSRVLAIPSRWPEPFGLVGLEAAHAGIPAVAFAVGGIPEWLTHDVNGRLAPAAGGAGSLATELLAALDPVVWTRLSAGARDATCRFSSGVHITALERVLHAARAA